MKRESYNSVDLDQLDNEYVGRTMAEGVYSALLGEGMTVEDATEVYEAFQDEMDEYLGVEEDGLLPELEDLMPSAEHESRSTGEQPYPAPTPPSPAPSPEPDLSPTTDGSEYTGDAAIAPGRAGINATKHSGSSGGSSSGSSSSSSSGASISAGQAGVNAAAGSSD